MADFDIVIKDGIVIDGTRSQRYRADVGIRDGRVAALGRLKTSDARRTLDATGMIVAPGFNREIARHRNIAVMSSSKLGHASMAGAPSSGMRSRSDCSW